MSFSDLSESERQKHFIDKANLVGRKIVAVRYMSDYEAEVMGWSSKSPVLQLDNGAILYPMRDDEGNDGGPLVVQTNGAEETLPVF